jgi:hypothetical protein
VSRCCPIGAVGPDPQRLPSATSRVGGIGVPTLDVLRAVFHRWIPKVVLTGIAHVTVEILDAIPVYEVDFNFSEGACAVATLDDRRVAAGDAVASTTATAMTSIGGFGMLIESATT